jgi:hypothetical protein
MQKTIVYCDICDAEHAHKNIDIMIYDTLKGDRVLKSYDVCTPCLSQYNQSLPIVVYGIDNPHKFNRKPKFRTKV